MKAFNSSRPRGFLKKSDGVDYIADLVGRVRLKLVRMIDATSATEPSFYIRHDVDWDLDHALQMAQVEANHGYFATYFLLTPGAYDGKIRNYYGDLEHGRIVHDPTLVDKCRRLLDLGHDVGFHNDLVALSLKTGRPPEEFLEAEVQFFQRNGIPMRGTAAHGNPLCRQLAFNNREIFAGCIRHGWEPGRTIQYQNRQVKLHSLHLRDYGLHYEAYSLPRDSRISDSGGCWAGRIAKEVLPKQRLKENFDVREFRAIMDRAVPANDIKLFSILTHPCHWEAA